MQLNYDDEPEGTSSAEETTHVQPSNSICLRIELEDTKKAEIVYNTLIIDKEPKRSRSQRELSLDGSQIVANIISDDPKSLMKSANNFFEMCQLSKNCIDVVGNYKLQQSATATETSGKKKKKAKK